MLINEIFSWKSMIFVKFCCRHLDYWGAGGSQHEKYLLCDAIRWEQLENWHFSRDYNFWTNALIFILKTPIRPFSCLAKVIICSELAKLCGSKVVGSWKVPVFKLFRSDCITLYLLLLVPLIIIVMKNEVWFWHASWDYAKLARINIYHIHTIQCCISGFCQIYPDPDSEWFSGSMFFFGTTAKFAKFIHHGSFTQILHRSGPSSRL